MVIYWPPGRIQYKPSAKHHERESLPESYPLSRNNGSYPARQIPNGRYWQAAGRSTLDDYSRGSLARSGSRSVGPGDRDDHAVFDGIGGKRSPPSLQSESFPRDQRRGSPADPCEVPNAVRAS